MFAATSLRPFRTPASRSGIQARVNAHRFMDSGFARRATRSDGIESRVK